MKLTVKEALEQGYTHWAFESDEPYMRKLSVIKPENFEDTTRPMLVNQKGYKFTVSPDAIIQLIVDMLVDQDEVADEDCELADLASEADATSLSNDINQRLAKKTFYDLTDIELIP